MHLTLNDNLVAVGAVLVATLSIARTARLLTYDDFPPIAGPRERLKSWLIHGDRKAKWAPLTECPFCLAPYLTAGMGLWMWLSELHWTWWVINGWWAMAYVASMTVARDEPPD